MPARDTIHEAIVEALESSGWIITADPFVLLFEEHHLFVDIAARSTRQVESQWVAAARGARRIAVEIKAFPGPSAISDLYRAIGQFVVYNLALREVEPLRDLFLAVSSDVFDELFSDGIGRLVLQRLPLRMLVVDLDTREVVEWIEPDSTGTP